MRSHWLSTRHRVRERLEGWLARRFPGVDPLSHDFGHRWSPLLGFEGNAHLNSIHLASNVVILLGFWLLASAWKVLYEAQRPSTLASTGPYAHIRHPQYAAFIVIMVGFLLQWPTLVTLVMFPILTITYVRLGRREEVEVEATRSGSHVWNGMDRVRRADTSLHS